MKRVLRRSGFAIVVGLGILGAGAACTEEQTGFFIRGNVVIEAPDCIASPEESSTLYSSGFLDVALTSEYIASLLVGSQLAPRGDKPNLRTETMITSITGAEVQLYESDGTLSTEYTVPATGTIAPDSSASAGFGIVTATLIPAATAQDITATLPQGGVATRIAEIRVFGKTLGGLEIESSTFTYVIRICAGCLVNFPAEALDASGGCTASVTEFDGEGPCRLGQDESVDCRVCVGGYAACQGPGL